MDIDNIIAAINEHLSTEAAVLTKLKANDDQLASYILLILQREKVVMNFIAELQRRITILENTENQRIDYALRHISINGREQ